MALFNCPECGKEISTEAKNCPHCGFPIKENVHHKHSKHKILRFSDKELLKAIKSKSKVAKKYIRDIKKFEKFIVRLERKIKKIPGLRKYLNDVLWMASLIKSYITKEYKEISLRSVLKIVSALAYVVSSIDLIHDKIPVIGYADDIAVIEFILKSMRSDIEKYKNWKKHGQNENKKLNVKENNTDN